MCALATLLLSVGSAAGASGGVGPGDACVKGKYGERALERGDCGPDVKTLNWLLAADSHDVPKGLDFVGRTHRAVRAVQSAGGLAGTGVVNGATRGELAQTMSRHKASWYGPGFYGNTTACGQTLRKRTSGVAHRTLPCGTKVVFKYGGRYVRTRVIDRGPFVKRRYERDWDLTERLAERLRFSGVDHVRAGVVR